MQRQHKHDLMCYKHNVNNKKYYSMQIFVSYFLRRVLQQHENMLINNKLFQSYLK